MEAKVLAVSKSGNSIFVNVRLNAFDTKGISGYCNNPQGQYKKDDVISNFPEVQGIEHRQDKDGRTMQTEDGTPLSFLVFKA